MRPGAFLQSSPTGAQLCPTGAQPGPTWNAAWMGREAEKIYSSFQLLTTVPTSAAGVDANVTADANAATPVADADNVNLVLKRFDRYFITKRNVIHERAKFHLRVQHAGENAKSFYRSLLELLGTCDFAKKHEKFEIDLLLAFLENCINWIRNSEMVKTQNEVVKGVDHVSCRGR